jgi:hypothetical protein
MTVELAGRDLALAAGSKENRRMSLGVGSRLGKYEIVAEIGHGGMSVVYRARDLQLQRDVAVKVMHAFLAEQPEAKERFHREAVAVARLRHPHIIEIYDYSGEDAAQSYIVTELVLGSSLAELLKRRPLYPPEAALVLARPIADALVHAHEHGVVHRDLKPENILVGQDGALKLTDFGIARMLDNQTLTVTGTLLGSPAYMAPEYIDGESTDERSDIFSFGAMLYQFTVGRLPFEALSPHALLKKIVSCEYLQPEQANPQVHAQIARIVRRCLARRPESRYQTAKELRTALDGVLERLGIDPETDRAVLLADGATYGEKLGKDLVGRYVSLGKGLLKERRVGAATEDFDRVLNLDPEHPEVRKIVRRLTRRATVSRIVRDGAIAIIGAAALTYGVAHLLEHVAPPAEEFPVVAVQQPLRAVGFVLRGRGDLYIGEELVERNVTGQVGHELPPGEYRVRFVGAEHTDEQVLVVPTEGAPKPLVLESLAPAPAPRESPTTTAVRRVIADPSKHKLVTFRVKDGLVTNLYVDGKLVRTGAQSPIKDVDLTYGEHRVRFATDFTEPAEIVVPVSDTEPPEIDPIVLKAQPARLFIDGELPPGAFVDVADKKRLVTPGEPINIPMADTSPVLHTVKVVVGDRVIFQSAPQTFRAGRVVRLAVPKQPL